MREKITPHNPLPSSREVPRSRSKIDLRNALAIRDNILPPTINLDNPDPDCDLDYVPNVARTARVHAVLSNGFGFGGHNSCLVLRRYV